MTEISPELSGKLKILEESLQSLGSVIVAYSGGVDSAFLLSVANRVLGHRCLAVTGNSESIPRSELEQSKGVADWIGAVHRIVETEEMRDADYIANSPDRCFHCKKTLFAKLKRIAEVEGFQAVAEGSNLDDLTDYRPGMKAAEMFGILSPLKEAQLTKDEIRNLSRREGLPTWDKPAAPCLSSRIPYGSAVTPEKLLRIELAEKHIRELGFPIVRVRDHGQMARIEVPLDMIDRLSEPETTEQISDRLRSVGYRFISVDPRGFRSGSLNEALEIGRDG